MIVILQPQNLIIDGKTVAAIMKQGDMRWRDTRQGDTIVEKGNDKKGQF